MAEVKDGKNENASGSEGPATELLCMERRSGRVEAPSLVTACTLLLIAPRQAASLL